MNNKASITALSIFFLLLLAACSKEKPIGEVEPLKNSYELPQGKSPADNRIVELYKKYGSYFLYEFSQRDFNWQFFDPSLMDQSSYFTSSYTPADPKYAGNILDYLNEAWFQYFPDSLLRKSIPYRVLFVSELYRELPGGKDKETQPHRLESNKFLFSGCNAGITKLTNEERKQKKQTLRYDLISFLLAEEILYISKEFFKISAYSVGAKEDPKSINYTRKRGFLADSSGYEWSIDIAAGGVPTQSDIAYYQQLDVSSYLYNIIRRSDKEWEKDFAFPIVKRKYDILTNYFKEKIGIDIHKMANEVYE